MKRLVTLLSKYLDRYKWLKFGLVGLAGTAIYYPILYCMTELGHVPYWISAVVGILAASTFNYYLNHIWTFNRQGKHNLLTGWLKYESMCAAFDGTHLAILIALTEFGRIWYIASSIIAIITIFAAKYVVSVRWIWKKQAIKQS